MVAAAIRKFCPKNRQRPTSLIDEIACGFDYSTSRMTIPRFQNPVVDLAGFHC